MSEQVAPNPAQVYDDYLVPAMFEPWAGELLARVTIRPGDRVLDVACGTGVVTRKIAPLAGRDGAVTGLDLSPHMLAVARSHPAPEGATIEWVEGSADALPLDDDAFDLVVCQQGLQFVPDRNAVAHQMHRVLRAGGRVGVSIWRDTSHQGLIGALSDAIDRHLGEAANDPFSLGDAGAVHDIFAQAGFDGIAIEPVRRRVRFPQPDRLIRLSVMAASAVIPELAEVSEAELDAAIDAIREDIGEEVEAARDGDDAVFFMESHIVTATA